MKRKLDILLMVMFLFGSMIFLCPIFGQIKEVEEDDRVYTRMSAEVKPPQQASGLVEDAPSPAAAAVQTVLPLLLEVPQAEKTAVPAAAPSPVRPAASDTAAPAQAERTANPRSVDVEACVAQNPDLRMAHHSGYAGGLSGCAVEQDGLLPDAPVQRRKQQAGLPVLAAIGGLSDTEQEHCHLRASPEP